MKRLSHFALFAIAMFFFACTEKGTGSTTASTGEKSAGSELLGTTHAVYRAIETGDSATLSNHISADAIDHGGGPNGEDVKGNDIVKMLSSFHKDVDNLKMEVIEEAASNDHIFAVVRMTGTTNKAVWGMPAGHKMDTKSIDLIKVSNGKMTDHWAYFEMAEAMKMMGAVKPEGSSAKK
ncbi:MAG TPA: ester cyclase [Segetibacter sp.]|jgi:predicted ester cyclase